MNRPSIPELAAKIWRDAGGDADDLSRLSFSSEEPVLPSPFRVDAAAGASIGVAGLAAAALHRTRTGEDQQVSVDLRHAAAAFRGEYHIHVDDGPAPDKWKSVSGYYQARDGRWMQLHCNFPHFRDGILGILGAREDREDVARQVAKRDGPELEQALIDAGMAAAMMRSPEEWERHPQAEALRDEPLFTIERIGDAPPEAPVKKGGPLAGIRVLDLSRVIAGPVCGRTLAGFGADVFRISSPDLPFVEDSVVATGFGKYAAHIDLRTDAGEVAMANMIHNADVFAQGYRPGSIAARGWSAERLAEQRPGIVYVELCAFGWVGPWAGRRGYDSIIQTTTGIAWEGGKAYGVDGPKPMPCQTLDHATGYLAAFGAMTALRRRAEEGGSWRVRVSLAQTRNWLWRMGRNDIIDRPIPDEADVGDYSDRMESPFGRLKFIAPAMKLSATPAVWPRPPVPLGTHPAIWPS